MAAFAVGFMVGRKTKTTETVTKEAVMQPDEAELRRIKREREELEADQRAFRTLVGYSADVAYGLTELFDGADRA